MYNVRLCVLGLFVLATAIACPAQARADGDVAMHGASAKVAADQEGFAPAPHPGTPKVTSNYAFATTTTASLTDMSSGTTLLIGPNSDDSTTLQMPLGFSFLFNGVRRDRFSVNENGVVRFDYFALPFPYKPLAQPESAIVTAYGANQRTHVVDGKVHFRTTGTAPNRVTTIEWLNNQSDSTPLRTADLTYQVRIHETTGCIEFIYGSMTMSAIGAGDVNSHDPHIGFSTGNFSGNVGSVAAPQSGIPAPAFDGVSETPAANLYAAGAITVLTSAAQGSRRNFVFCAPAPAPAGGPLTFTGVTPSAMTLNWADAPDELGYEIHVSTDGINFSLAGTVGKDATAFAASALNPSTNYTWQVRSFSEATTGPTLTAEQVTAAAGLVSSTAAGGNWSSPATWTGGIVPTSADVVTIASGAVVTIDVTTATALSVNVDTGAVLLYQDTPAATLSVVHDVTVQPGAVLRSGTTGNTTTHLLRLGGSLSNDGTLDFSTNADTAGAGITFTGSADRSFGGSGATTDVRTVTVDKGTSSTSVLHLNPANFTVRGASTDTAGWLAPANGTLRLSGAFAGANRVFQSPVIPATAGFWLDNPNYVVTAQAGNTFNLGLLRVSQGVFNQGTLASHSLRGGAGAQFVIEGGTLNLAAQFIPDAGPSSYVTYTQSGGTVNVGLVGNSESSIATFDLASDLSGFKMTAGTIVLHQASVAATPIDYRNNAITIAAAGTLVVGSAATATNFDFRVRGRIPNLVIDNTVNNKTATLVAGTTLSGTTLINPGATLAINGQRCIVSGPTFTNDGILDGASAFSRLYFLGGSGPTTYTGTGVVTPPLASFEVDNVAGVTIDPGVNQVVTEQFRNLSGGLTGSGKLTIASGAVAPAIIQLGGVGVVSPVLGFDVPPLFNIGSGGIELHYAQELTGRTTGNELPPSRTLNRLSVTNPNPITIAGGDVTVTGTAGINLAGGRVITGGNALYHSAGTGTVTRTTGYVDGNFRKAVTVAGPKLLEVGTANGYSPVLFNVAAGTLPADVAARAVETSPPGFPSGQSIARYWDLTASGITADLTFSYLDPPDVPGTVTETALQVYRSGGGSFTNVGGTVNAAANTATVTGVTTFSNWTLGVSGSLTIMPTAVGFGDQAVGTSSTESTVTLANSGGASLDVTALSDATAPFARTAGGTCSATLPITIGVGGGCSLTYTYSPTATGPANQTLTVATNALGGGTIDLSGNGIQGNLLITPAATEFGATVNGTTSVERLVTLSNAGSASFGVTGLTTADVPFARTATGTCGNTLPFTIAVGNGCTLSYTFSPTAAGTATQNFTVTSDASGDTTFDLNGTGVATEFIHIDGFEDP